MTRPHRLDRAPWRTRVRARRDENGEAQQEGMEDEPTSWMRSIEGGALPEGKLTALAQF
ncbi:hypothetical protein [Deinococcus yavapaiensis]|uniref:hypothetical protein n=1 Tax=Deinococcus yavapaiensis TaxID=309889 RepID=UPI0014740189|nr:hypothetical protein [Deinococcus yavapaiensis]